MTSSDKFDAPKGRKTFVPLENNPEVMSHLAHRLGVSYKLGFQDVYSIDDPELLAFVPRPAYALLFICPAKVYWKTLGEEIANMPEYDGSGENEPVVWFKQTIGHACGLIGLLHGVCNGGAKEYIQPGSDLYNLLKEAIPLKPTPRADLLYNSSALESAHQSAAQEGDTEAPSAEEDNHFHFICFVKDKDGHMWELDGGRKGPMDRGALGPDEDVLSEKALQLGVRAFLAKEAQLGGGELRFSLVALVPNFD